MSKTNGLAITSLVMGILTWVFALIWPFLDWIFLPSVDTFGVGVGRFLQIYVPMVEFLSPLGWLAGVITGYASKRQIKQTGEGGEGMANAGLNMSLIGLGLYVLVLYVIFFGPYR